MKNIFKIFLVTILIGYKSYGQTNDFNWTESISYDLNNNKIFQSKTYFDDTSKPLVSLTKDFVTNFVWGSETVYDGFGRAFKQSFPAPSTLEFDKVDFLSNPTIYTNNLSKYYSNNNTFEPYQATATQPYLQVNYDKLNPGNVINAVGGNQINGQWKTGSQFTVPAAQEMYYVYGYDYFDGPVTNGKEEVITQFFKTVSTDANGVSSVVFTDGEGKILAAAKSGGNATYPVLSLIGTQGFVDVHIPDGISEISFLGPASNYKVFSLTTGEELAPVLNGGQAYRIVALTPPSVEPKVYIQHNSGVADQLSYSEGAQGIIYKVNYYDYGINIYNKAGQLVKNVQPNACDIYSIIPITAAPSYMANTATDFISTYTYAPSGLVSRVIDTDKGNSRAIYRKDGQIRYSQSSQLQQEGTFSYIDYDSYGRPIEVGVMSGAWLSAIQADPDGALVGGTRTQQTFTIYDFAENNQTSVPLPSNLLLENALNSAGIQPSLYVQKNLSAGGVAITYTKPSADITAVTWYSYDIYGRVEWVVQYNNGIGIKTIDYEYDTRGNIKKIIFQKNKPTELFVHRYSYDLNGTLQKVETSTDNLSFLTHADYSYYVSGELKRINIAEGAQGLDYVYTLGGMLKSINHPSLEQSKDPGGDPNDLFGMTIDYYSGDYQRLNTNITTSPSISLVNKDMYNGNIKAVRWANKSMDVVDLLSGSIEQKAYTYNYNGDNFLKTAKFGTADNSGLINIGNPSKRNIYFEGNIEYDPNGNIISLQRTSEISSKVDATLVDNLAYNYIPGKNQLDYVTDTAVVSNGFDSQPANNYTYNNDGQLINNAQENLNYYYNIQGLVTEVRKGMNPIVKFYYNERGQRIKKEMFNTLTYELESTDYYIVDISGNVMSIYNEGQFSRLRQMQLPIYGYKRLGLFNKTNNSSNYEITDHLGNVRAVVKKITGNPVIQMTSFADYYPFGEKLPVRNASDGNYRYAFQGQELDSETGMEAFQLRLWDGRIGRWLSPDPFGQHFSPYMGMANNPVNIIDIDGGWDSSGDPPKGFWGWLKSLFGSDDVAYNVQLDPVEIEGGGMNAFWTGLFGDTFSQGNWMKPYEEKQKQVDLYSRIMETKDNLEDLRDKAEYVPGVDAYFSVVADEKYAKGTLQALANLIPIGKVLKPVGKVVPLKKVVSEGMTKILKGEGNAIMRNGVHQVVEARPGTPSKYVGGLEWKIDDLPGTHMNGSRIIEKVQPDGTTIYGYLWDHNYKVIYDIPTMSPLR